MNSEFNTERTVQGTYVYMNFRVENAANIYT